MKTTFSSLTAVFLLLMCRQAISLTSQSLDLYMEFSIKDKGFVAGKHIMLRSQILGSFESIFFFLITCVHSNLVLDIFHLPVYVINHINANNRYLVFLSPIFVYLAI